MRNQRKLFTSPVAPEIRQQGRGGGSAGIFGRPPSVALSPFSLSLPPLSPSLSLSSVLSLSLFLPHPFPPPGRPHVCVLASFLFLPPRVSPRFEPASFAGGSQTLSGSNDASSGNGEGSSRPEVHHIRMHTQRNIHAYTDAHIRTCIAYTRCMRVDAGHRYIARARNTTPCAHK